MATHTRSGMPTGQRHNIRFATRNWEGVNRRLLDDSIGLFRTFLPLRPRGPQIVLDPFEPVQGDNVVTGRTFSPGRLLDPASDLKAWVDGTEVTCGGDGGFTAAVKLGLGDDQITLRATDATKRDGRGYNATWAGPRPPAPAGPSTQRIRMRLEDEDGGALAGLPFVLKVAGRQIEGMTDDAGYVMAEVPVAAKTGELTFWTEPDKSGDSFTWPLKIADIREKKGGASGGPQSVAAAVYCGDLGGFFRSARAAPDPSADPAQGPLLRPGRYGRTRAEVQRFKITPPIKTAGAKIDFVVKDDTGAEKGRASFDIETKEGISFTPWVCITQADTAEGAPDLPVVDGKILRVETVKWTIELEYAGALVGARPVKLSGWDGSAPQLADRTQGAQALGGTVGGSFGEEALRLRWMTDADRDGVLIPAARNHPANQSLEGEVANRAGELEGEDPVDFSAAQVQMPLGWAALGVEGRESEDPWPEEDAHDVVTYEPAAEANDAAATDFVYTGRPMRVIRHDDEGWAAHPDQLLVVLKAGTADPAVKDLCKKYSLRLSSAVRRDGHLVLESPEPLDLKELGDLKTKVAGESCVDSVDYNGVFGSTSVAVTTSRVTDPLVQGQGGSGGTLKMPELLAIYHHLNTRAFPAQALTRVLMSQVTGTAPSVGIAITDSGFGNGSHPSISPDFSPSRFPWGARRAGTPTSGTDNAGLITQHALTDTLIRETPAHLNGTHGMHGWGHGTICLHLIGGQGIEPPPPPAPPATQGATVAPPPPPRPLDPASWDPANHAWSGGVCPFADLLPIRIAQDTGGTGSTWFEMASSIRWAFNQTGISIVSASWGGLFNGGNSDASATQVAWLNTLFKPAFDAARAKGGIFVNAAGNDGVKIERANPGAIGPTAARTATSNPMIVVGTSVISFPDWNFMTTTAPAAGAANGPETQGIGALQNPLDSSEALGASVDLNTTSPSLGGPRYRSNYGPGLTVVAPGDRLFVRSGDLTAPHQGRTAPTTMGALQEGTSFATPQVAGLLGLMMLADQSANPPAAPRAGADAANYANKLIDMLAFTAYREGGIAYASPNAFAPGGGHGRVDCWAAVLSVVNGGPMQLSTATGPQASAAHSNLTNLGAAIGATATKWYGFEVDTNGYHARPLLVNATTGTCEPLTDGAGVEPVVGSGGQVRAHLVRSQTTAPAQPGVQAQGELPIPVQNHPGPEAQYFMQFSIPRERLAEYTHLALERAGEPEAEPGGSPGTPRKVYFGLPLQPLLDHNLQSGLTGFNVDGRHFIYKTRAGEHDRKVRVTFDRIEVSGLTGTSPSDLHCNGYIGTENTGSRAVRAKNGVNFLDGPEWSKVVTVDPATPQLAVSMDVTEISCSTARNHSTRTTPPTPDVLPYGLGCRSFDAGGFKFHYSIDHEPAYDRRWKLELTTAAARGATPNGEYRFCIEVSSVRSAWSTTCQVGTTIDSAKVDKAVKDIHAAITRRVVLVFHDVDEDKLFGALDPLSPAEREVLETRYEATYHQALRAALNEQVSGSDLTRAMQLLDEGRPRPPTTLSPGTVTVEGPWTPGAAAHVVVRWQNNATLDFGLAVQDVTLLERSGEQTVALVADTFELTVKVTSTPAAA